MLSDTRYQRTPGQKAANDTPGCQDQSMPSHVSMQELRWIVNRTAQALGVGNIPRSWINGVYDSGVTESWISGEIQIWVDRYYVAWMNGTQDIRYVYLSWYHIHEERKGYVAASRRRGRKIRPPRDIQAAFALAERAMRRAGVLFWIDDDFG